MVVYHFVKLQCLGVEILVYDIVPLMGYGVARCLYYYPVVIKIRVSHMLGRKDAVGIQPYVGDKEHPTLCCPSVHVIGGRVNHRHRSLPAQIDVVA